MTRQFISERISNNYATPTFLGSQSTLHREYVQQDVDSSQKFAFQTEIYLDLKCDNIPVRKSIIKNNF